MKKLAYSDDIVENTENAPKRRKYCPLNSLKQEDSYCVLDECAWWVIGDRYITEGKCAITQLIK